MPKHCRRPEPSFPRQPPGLAECLFHRCEQHEGVPQLNAEEEQTQSECGACVAEESVMLRTQQLLILEGFADNMRYSAELRAKLMVARGRLNMLQPGAGDFLNEFDAGDTN